MDNAFEEEIRRLLASSGKIAAIKRYREATGVGLAEAKSAVDRLLLACPDGVFVLLSSGAMRLLPTVDEMKVHCDALRSRHSKEPLTIGLSFEHGAISPDGKLNGYLRAFDLQGNFRWQHFIGSTICDLDISSDERRLIVTTYAGFLCILDLDTGEPDPFVIGTATHKERRRWLFWKKEPKPLIW